MANRVAYLAVGKFACSLRNKLRVPMTTVHSLPAVEGVQVPEFNQEKEWRKELVQCSKK